MTLKKSYGGGGLFLIIDNLLNALYLPKPLLQCAKINLFPFISAPDRYFHRKNRHQRSNPPKLVVHPLEPFHCIPWSVSSFVLNSNELKKRYREETSRTEHQIGSRSSLPLFKIQIRSYLTLGIIRKIPLFLMF